MKLQTQSIHFNADAKLLEFIQKKADKLDMFYDRIIDGEVYLRLDKSENAKNKVAEIKINIPGATLFSSKQCQTFEEAADLAIDNLRRQLRKHKTKVLKKV